MESTSYQTLCFIICSAGHPCNSSLENISVSLICREADTLRNKWVEMGDMLHQIVFRGKPKDSWRKEIHCSSVVFGRLNKHKAVSLPIVLLCCCCCGSCYFVPLCLFGALDHYVQLHPKSFVVTWGLISVYLPLFLYSFFSWAIYLSLGVPADILRGGRTKLDFHHTMRSVDVAFKC